MSATVLTYTYTGSLSICIDGDAGPMQQMTTKLDSQITGSQKGFPKGADEEFTVQILREAELDFPNDALGQFLYLFHAGAPANSDPLERHRKLLNRLHAVKSGEIRRPLPPWKRWLGRRLGILPAA